MRQLSWRRYLQHGSCTMIVVDKNQTFLKAYSDKGTKSRCQAGKDGACKHMPRPAINSITVDLDTLVHCGMR